MPLVDSGKRIETDKKFDADEADVRFSNYLFLRLVARRRSFKHVDFRYSVFDACYLRECHFDLCDFTGCRFVATNFRGSKFSGCKFDYANFERTFVNSDILDTECPGLENLKATFARSLRINYQQLGDAGSANKAIKVELQATEVHLHKSWKSTESYYRQKYKGWRRVKAFLIWLEFKALDFIWGNGESAVRLGRFVFLILCLMAIFDVLNFGDADRLTSYGRAIANAPEVFLGILAPEQYPKWYLAVITFVRLVAIGFFLSIIIRDSIGVDNAYLRIRFHLSWRRLAGVRHRSPCGRSGSRVSLRSECLFDLFIQENLRNMARGQPVRVAFVA